ncbi:TetR/AcrR family transcriptional regulator [Luteipulveratus flavus]|uniref:TetR/AcrR family transcriptional regulator n=1 Tax=Luteipulveratus flavus TaxID=3031728 RepID=A0ABT6C287_9MICO|nr:TetR/AcrR family transcriptional regulator [Luteipulveratus sp. YIM 133296]MDF8263024.1 TetR/AcrR family transcriptional regulator [Luteipulveratus sp. YIM 133296]
MTGSQPSRRGRLPRAEREARRQEIVDAARAELVESGFDRLTMAAVARRAGASKETLYAWFGSREQLVAALIEDNADASAERVAALLEGAAAGDPHEVLTAYARGLLELLCGESSIALNRAAMTSPELAATLLAGGRHRVGPLVEAYLARASTAGELDVPDPAEWFRLLYGLVVQDTQIRVLLGERPPSPRERRRQADQAVERFLALSAGLG